MIQTALTAVAIVGVLLACVAQAASGRQTPRPVAPQDAPPRAAETRPTSRPTIPETFTVVRVGGKPEAEAVQIPIAEGVGWSAGRCRVTTPLPQGYPTPTPPGAIDLKSYPSVRRAEATSSMGPDFGRNLAFWPLFRHIQSRGIAMTSPVEMDYAGVRPDGHLDGSSWKMSFLYRTADLGPAGAAGTVAVVDQPPLLALSLGLRGSYDTSRLDRELAPLDAWLAENPEWERAGSPRALFYNGPDVRSADKWSEIQIPVRRKATESHPTTR